MLKFVILCTISDIILSIAADSGRICKHYIMSELLNELQAAIDQSRKTLAELQEAMSSLRQLMTNEHPNITLANDILRASGYMHESFYKLEQWGILNATSEEVQKIIQLVTEYRKEHSSN